MTTPAPLLGEPLPVELMNTIWADRDGVHDALQTPPQLARWLVSVGERLDLRVDDKPDAVPESHLTQTWARMRELRDALRRLAAEATHDDRPSAASAVQKTDRALVVLNDAAAHAPRWSALELSAAGATERVMKAHKSAPDAAISQIADEATALFAGESGPTLRACQAPGCVLYFVKQHPRREWCSAGCGNRARVARHYQRHHTAHA